MKHNIPKKLAIHSISYSEMFVFEQERTLSKNMVARNRCQVLQNAHFAGP